MNKIKLCINNNKSKNFKEMNKMTLFISNKWYINNLF